MPSLARKLLIFAAIDGLVLQPLSQRGQSRPAPAPAVKINYKDGAITSLREGGLAVEGAKGVGGENEGNGFEAFGIVGLLMLSKSSFLISITRRQQVAQIKGKPIYVATEVALTPLTSKEKAELSIQRTRKALMRKSGDAEGSEDSDTGEDGEGDATVSDDVDDDELHAAIGEGLYAGMSQGEHKRSSSVAEDVMTRRGGYGPFAQKWFSTKGWTAGQRRNLGMSISEASSASSDRTASPNMDPKADGGKPEDVKGRIVNDVAERLLPKLLRTTQILFGTSKSFFFSYDYDITRSLGNQQTINSDVPLYKEVDPLFFWNKHVIQPFIDAGQSSLVLPLMQGFVGQRSFSMDTNPPKPILGLEAAGKSAMELTDWSPSEKVLENIQSDAGAAESPNQRTSSDRRSTEKPFLLTLISRRSVKRAGLRYLRRGVDQEGYTANSVETEQILSDSQWSPSSHIYSFLQLRGSIPIFFSQSPYSFKPVPKIEHSTDLNYSAFKKHFENILTRYGSIQVASLVEKHGNEAIVGDEYERAMKKLNQSNGNAVGFEWFDFHAICRGMKFENVSLLMESLGDKLDTFGNSVEVDGGLVAKQSGILRTNCMDCLDRTNVVQSACGRRALELQLKNEGIDMSLQTDQTTQWFNTLWADNGDAISNQYASTAALKGDFTRTRKRDYKGALKDMGLSISRLYNGAVNDYFSQTAIDFLVGNVTPQVFEDFEANMMSVDPAVSPQKMRQQAIEVSQKLVVADEHEELIGGWTLLTPQVSNTIKSSPFQEAVLLLTDRGVYACRFDWNMEKVLSFERIELEHIIGIKYGVYITSTLSRAQSDEKRNVGLVISYKAGSNNITRVNTRSMSTAPSREESDLLGGTSITPAPSSIANLIGLPSAVPHRVLALKALPSQSAVTDGNDSPRVTEMEQVKTVCGEIERMVKLSQVVELGSERREILEAGDIISLADARRSTGLLEQLGHSLKKFVWA
ncbi:hypothetical protein B7494_g3605 [Chlorociboria aeruginascens]|nr:hypothetical protein B7494_g3605 [Chlorociboria aeruginascens]